MMRERTRLESSLGEIHGLANGLAENLELLELAEAEKFKSSRGMAQQWSKFVESEKASSEQIQAELGS